MKNKLVIISLILLVGIVIWVIIQNQSSVVTNNNTGDKEDSVVSSVSDTMTDISNDPIAPSNITEQEVDMEKPLDNSPVSVMGAPGTYEAYNTSLLAKADNGDVVLFFRASWCPTCRALDTDIKANQVPDGLTILDINYDDSSELRKKYGVTVQHTLVKVDSKGELIKKWSGGNTLDTIIKQI